MRALAVAAAVGGLLAAAAPASAADCPNAAAATVPGAERQEQACLDDLTTAGTQTNGHTDAATGRACTRRARRTRPASPGLQIDGYFPDTSTSNGTHGWNHDSQFVIRMPNDWNGKLVITGAPGVRKQYASDFVIGDFVLGRGYAYASTDKGNTGTEFYEDGAEPGDAIAEWNRRVTELAIAAKETVARRYGRAPARTYVTGISNGGYLTRWQLENRPDLYDGGVDWEGTLFDSAPGAEPAQLPPAGAQELPALPRDRRRRRRTTRSSRPASRPARSSSGTTTTPSTGTSRSAPTARSSTPTTTARRRRARRSASRARPNCDADYDYGARAGVAGPAIDKVANTGRIGKPLLTLHGTLDTLLPIRVDSDVYARKVAAAGAGALHRYYVIEKGNHVDGRYDAFPDRLRPMLPCHHTAFVALERWVEQGAAPPDSQFVPKGGGDVVNTCELPAPATRHRRPDRAGRPGAPPARAPARDGHAAARPPAPVPLPHPRPARAPGGRERRAGLPRDGDRAGQGGPADDLGAAGAAGARVPLPLARRRSAARRGSAAGG